MPDQHRSLTSQPSPLPIVDPPVSSVDEPAPPASAAITIFDRPLCCSTGVCGPDVDPELPRFAADLERLSRSGVRVERFNLAQQPDQFIQQDEVKRRLSADGVDGLPLIVVDGRVVSEGHYPTYDAMAEWVGKPHRGVSSVDAGCCGGAAAESNSAGGVEDTQAEARGDSGCGCDESGCC